MLNQSEPNLILTAHATKLNRPEPNSTEPQTCLAGRNHALDFDVEYTMVSTSCVHWDYRRIHNFVLDGVYRGPVDPEIFQMEVWGDGAEKNC